MKHNIVQATVMTALLAISVSGGTALAGPTCTKENVSKWMSKLDMQKKILASGYTIDRFKVTDGNCYEIYGYNQSNQKVEIYFHPITGEIVKQEIDD